MRDEAKEVRVFVRNGIPWIDSACPACGISIVPSNKFCPCCGQKLSSKFYYEVLDTGGVDVPTPDNWREILPEEFALIKNKLSVENFTRRLKLLEKEFGIEEFDTKDHSLLRIMRKAYIETCFEEKK